MQHTAADEPVAIVTGASRGVGREVARTLARRGYAVVVVYVRDQGDAEAAVEEILATSRSNGLAPGLEPPGADDDAADLVALLDRWRGTMDA